MILSLLNRDREFKAGEEDSRAVPGGNLKGLSPLGEIPRAISGIPLLENRVSPNCRARISDLGFKKTRGGQTMAKIMVWPLMGLSIMIALAMLGRIIMVF